MKTRDERLPHPANVHALVLELAGAASAASCSRRRDQAQVSISGAWQAAQALAAFLEVTAQPEDLPDVLKTWATVRAAADLSGGKLQVK